MSAKRATGRRTATTSRRTATTSRRTATTTRRTGTTTRRTGKKPVEPGGRGTWHSVTRVGLGTRAYHVYMPKGLRRTTRAPLLMALHGCGQTAMEFAAATRFSELADKHQFIVVFPEQSLTANGQRCWNWHQPGNQFRYQGEPAILATLVRSLMNNRARWRIDPERVYAAGLSAGGAVATTLGVTYPDLFAAIGVHSGPPYRSASAPTQIMAAMQGRRLPPPPPPTSTETLPPTIIFQGTGDGTVWPANAQRIADQWIGYYARDPQRPALALRDTHHQQRTPVTKGSPRGYRVRRWSVNKRRVLELWLVDGLPHAWSGGKPGVASSDRRGPRASTEMWRFFSSHRLGNLSS